MSVPIYLVAYDIASPARLQRVGRCVKGYKAAGQKSVAECWLQGGARDRLLRALDDLMDPASDRLSVIRLDPRLIPYLFGIAARPSAPVFVVT